MPFGRPPLNKEPRAERDVTHPPDDFPRVPFNADTPFSIIHDHIYTPLPLPRIVNPNVPEPVERVVPNEREATIRELSPPGVPTVQMMQLYPQDSGLNAIEPGVKASRGVMVFPYRAVIS